VVPTSAMSWPSAAMPTDWPIKKQDANATTAVRFHSQTYKPRAGGITVGDEPLSGKAEAETGWR
jgi:hypothetical protein